MKYVGSCQNNVLPDTDDSGLTAILPGENSNRMSAEGSNDFRPA